MNSSKRKTQKSTGKQKMPKVLKTKPKKSLGESSFQSSEKQRSVAAAYATGQRTRQPKIVSKGDSVRIIHRELISSVVGSQSFSVQQAFALNPGLASSFPWLATQAQSWERYRFNSLKFCYYTRTGSNVPGSVMLVPDYDAADSAPISEQIASAYSDVAEDAPWKDIDCLLRASALHALGPTKFVRTGALQPNQDIKTYDAGNLFLIVTDGTAVNWGKLWVEYDVELLTPQLNPAGGGVISSQILHGSAPISSDPLVGALPVAGSSNITSPAPNVLTFNQAGQFLVNLLIATEGGHTVTVNAAPVAGNGGNILDQTWFGAGDASLCHVIQMTAVVGSTLTFNDTISGGGDDCSLVVSQLASNLGSMNF